MAVVTGTSGADLLNGTSLADEISGFAGADTLRGHTYTLGAATILIDTDVFVT